MAKLELYKILKKVIFRSLGVQNLWNYRYMQLYGYIYAILPLYRYIYTKEEIIKRLNIQWEYFNTHPYVSSYILAMHSKMLILNEDENEIQRMRNNLMSPLASIGDSFFWGTLRSFLISISIFFMLIFFSQPALLLIFLGTGLLFFNIIHFYHIFKGFQRTFRYGRLNLKFTRKFFFFEKLITFASSVFFTFSSAFLLKIFNSLHYMGHYKYLLIFILFIFINIFFKKYIKKKGIIILFNTILAIIFTLWGII
ncbi:PTS system mannose/fructose/sorbose family transporter subunit IID [bacterium]|nr:PTS system mannose/fructose/sorbose family transporter subunit IID [bacterium]